MNVADIFNVSSVNYANTISNTGITKKVQEENGEVAAIFSSMMNQTPNYSMQVGEESTSTMEVSKVESKGSATESYERYNYKQNKIETAKEPTIEEKLENSADELAQFEEDALNAISKEFGVEKEEIVGLLEEMGLSVMDLLNPQNLVSFVMELTGMASKEELLLNESFLNIMGTLDSMKHDLMKELDVTLEGLNELIAEMKVLNTKEDIPTDFEETLLNQINQEETVVDEKPLQESVSVEDPILNSLTEEVSTKEVSKEIPKEVSTEVVTETVTEETTQTEVPEEIITTESDNAEEMIITEEDNENLWKVPQEEVIEEQAVQQTPNKGRNADNKNNFANNHQQNDAFVMNNTASNVQTIDVSQTQAQSYVSAQTMQIMEQIAEQVKVTVQANTTSMEMQLNPETLGKIYLNITEEEGIINARFAVTTELVKEALEAQLATLRDNLNQAGVKVDSVEVTIASHEFEKNLEQDQKRQENETARQQEELNNRRRNLHIGSLDELSGLMTEEERLVAQIMKDNGNSVDLTA